MTSNRKTIRHERTPTNKLDLLDITEKIYINTKKEPSTKIKYFMEIRNNPFTDKKKPMTFRNKYPLLPTRQQETKTDYYQQLIY